ncbi:cupin domain-containing protein [Undibacterium sp.]|jgi:mannose-6-phosphate isomerase-like protein (cupin superfamily)|uniref:cupin domain-containing protein n=1 Tax=Undibacterium sp. TaxID=1914977 RepID=UPI002CE1546C|nr:cupin domain-containing protein [Undibacterium sp.]HTD03871.1 cupin domain-containing protein [Undibacterium sp.]
MSQPTAKQLQTIDLVALGQQQAVDTDYLLTRIVSGSLLLLNQRPQHYPQELHKVEERIIVLQGRVGITAGAHKVDAAQGQMIMVPAGLSHAYSEDSDGVVAVLFGQEQA